MRIAFDRELVEATVLEAAHRRALDPAFHLEREKVYETADRGERAREFDGLYRRWFDRLAGPNRLVESIASRADLESGIGAATVCKATERAKEGAELLVAKEGPSVRDRRHLVFMLVPETLLDPEALDGLLSRELLFIQDMIDEAFAYEPVLPKVPGGTSHDRLILSRYGALWSASVAGRLVRAGLAPQSVREGARSVFARAFPGLGDRVDEAFQRVFEQRPSHPELVGLSLAPRRLLGEEDDPSRERCPLCGLPARDRAEAVDDRTAARIRHDFPDWSSETRPCIQCADLYRAREGLRGDEEEGEREED